MVNGRQDGWSVEEDNLLSETVLKYIKDGSTQLKAFEEVGRQLSRTAAACGFRWNSFVRKQFQEEIHQAKVSRRKREQLCGVFNNEQQDFCENKQKQSQSEEIDFDSCIAYLQKINRKFQGLSLGKFEDIIAENHLLQNKMVAVTRERDALAKQCAEVVEDYQSLLGFFEKARRLAINEAEEVTKIKFQMDQNGNLERV